MTDAQDGFRLRPSKSPAPHAKNELLIVNSPSNPSGAVVAGTMSLPDL